MSQLWLDDESFSPVPITCGTHAYAEKVEILIRAMALDDGAVLVRDLTAGGADWVMAGAELTPAPLDLVRQTNMALADDTAQVWAHQSAFDRTIERWAGITIPLHRWRDTMVQAMAHGLPGKLSELCAALKIDADQAKDKEGKALIRLFCMPQPFKFRKRHDALIESAADYAAAKEAAAAAWTGRATRETHPAEWRKFLLYAGRDIIAMRACHKKMPMWNYRDGELALWHLDQQINDRGVAIDLELAECAVNAVDAAQVELREQCVTMTNGEVESATKRDAILLHVLAEYGVDLPDLQKATLERRIGDPDLPEGLRELLRVRLQASTTSTSKYKTLIKGVSSDSRLRGLLQFCGASRTGRWAGRLWQPQNLPRPTLKQHVIDMGIEALKAGGADLIFDNVMELTSSAIRGCIVAAPGKKLVVADLSNIEGRVLAWLGGETWKLKAFGAYDAGTGHDLYVLAYAKAFNVSAELVKENVKAGGNWRQIGKVMELALGYEGGVGAFLTFAAAYGIDLEAMAAQAIREIPGNVIGQARIMLEWHRKKNKKCPAAAFGLSEQAWLVCESFKLAWRAAHPNVVQLWRDMDANVRAAIQQPGTTFTVGLLKVRKDGAWLRIVLPSGRAVCYPGAALMPANKRKRAALIETAGAEEVEAPDDGGKTVITYMGINQYSRKWERIDTYSGKIAENVTQAVARDVMANGMPEVESWRPIMGDWADEESGEVYQAPVMYEGLDAEGFRIVLSVHDELITEAPDRPEYSEAALSNILATVPTWANGLPLAAAGFESNRYKK